MSPLKEGASQPAEDYIGQVLAELSGTRNKLSWIISVHGNEGLNYALLEADSYL